MDEAALKLMKASRGYNKASITRLYQFVSNSEDVKLSSVTILQAKRARITELFSEYESYNKKILAIDEKDNENVEECEAKYFHVLTVLNEAILSKSTPNVDNAPAFKAKLPAIQVQIFSGKYCEYTPFINMFRAIIHKDRSIDKVQKLYYLRSFLQKEPFDIIKNLPLSHDSYDEALRLLDERYNHRFKIIIDHNNALLDLNALSKSTPVNIREFVSSIKQCLAALKNLKVNVEGWDPLILSILYRKLDTFTSRAYQLERSNESDPTVVEFLSFLEKRALALENAEPTTSTKAHKVVTNVATASATNSCAYCKSEQHKLFSCNDFKLLPSSARIEFVKSNKLCVICLNKHNGKCKFHFRCKTCKKDHNTLLHEETAQEQPVSLISSVSTPKVLLPTVKVKLYSKSGREVHIKAILDSASQISLVTSKVIDVLGITPIPDNTDILGVSNSSNIANYSVPLEVFSLVTPYKVNINCHVLKKITCKIPQFKVDLSCINIPTGVTLADVDFNIPSEINMLIGADIFFQVLLPEPVEVLQPAASQFTEQTVQQQHLQPRLISTRFGHVIAGALTDHAVSDKSNVSLLCIHDKGGLEVNKTLQQFWSTESVPQYFSEKGSEHDLCEGIFKETTILKDKKFQVNLPLKISLDEVKDTLGNSFDFALYRFLSLERKLHKNPKLLSDYDKFISEYVQLGHGHYVEFNSLDFKDKPLYFMPHHAVYNENSKSTKTRVVFDASMQTDKKRSLNDLLLNGAPVQKELFDIMLLFRLGDYTFTTDIRRMFRCVNVNPEHSVLQNILWRNNVNDKIKCIQLDTVTYGQKSSGFLATRCLHELAETHKQEYPLASYILNNCTYVDDACYSHSDLNVIKKAKQQLCELLSKGSFETHKWASNCQQILEDISPDNQHFDDFDLQKDNCFMKTLGLTLNVSKDCFVFSCPEPFNIENPTKRQILSYISKFFDPLGFMSPVIVKAKAFMQKLWLEKLDWDDFPPEGIRLEWLSFVKSLMDMQPLHIDRNIRINKNANAVQLIGFADASSSTGYGCCVYLRVVKDSGKASSSLLCSKSRINPRSNNALTIPRLELNAMLLLTKLANRVYDTLSLKIKISDVYLYSDSQVALAWLATEPIKLQAYVANRVKLIQEQTSRWRWLYVASNENPADYVSRGAVPGDLSNCELWWHGPEFMLDSKYDFDKKLPIPVLENLPEMKKGAAFSDPKVALITLNKSNIYLFIDKYSDLNKMIHVMAYILRFCYNLDKRGTPLSPLELEKALHKIIQREQSIHFSHELNHLNSKDENIKGPLKPLHPFIDKEHMLRVGGRIDNSEVSFSQKHPIILPKQSRVTDLIIYQEHIRLLHSGARSLLASLNEKYWIVNGYRHVKKIIHKCLLCYRMKAKCAKQLMGSLPSHRVTACRPFQKIGIDFAGPIQVKNSRVRRAIQTKGYICVFVCFVTKAIHLEIASDLSTDCFLACFKRFIARRGLPTDVFCDNAGCFKGARNELVQLYNLQTSREHQALVQGYATKEGITFHFVPSYSPVFAGLAEAAVKSMKFHLKRIIQNYVLTYEQLNTVLCQIEAVLNSRPLLPVTAEKVDDFSYLTPGHFLIGTSLTSYPENNTNDIPVNRLKFWEICNKVRTQFWNVWHKYYLNVLQSRPKWRDSVNNIKVGNLVILREPNSPPLSWPMARIVKVYPGPDGKVRVVDVMTPNQKIYKRSLSAISLLPLEE